MPRQAKEADAHFRAKYGKPLDEFYDDGKYQLMHIELFNHGIIHAECLGGDIDLLLNRRAVIGAFPWRLVDGESCICRIVAFVDDDEHAALMAKKAKAELTKFGDVAGAPTPGSTTRRGRDGGNLEAGRTVDATPMLGPSVEPHGASASRKLQLRPQALGR